MGILVLTGAISVKLRQNFKFHANHDIGTIYRKDTHYTYNILIHINEN